MLNILLGTIGAVLLIVLQVPMLAAAGFVGNVLCKEVIGLDIFLPLKLLISLSLVFLVAVAVQFVFKLLLLIAKATDILFEVLNEWLLTKATLHIYDLKEIRESTYKQVVFIDGKPVEKS